MPIYECRNDTENRIVLERGVDTIDLSCRDCARDFHYGEYESGKSLEELQKALNETYNFPSMSVAEYDEDTAKYKVTHRQFKVAVKERTDA